MKLKTTKNIKTKSIQLLLITFHVHRQLLLNKNLFVTKIASVCSNYFLAVIIAITTCLWSIIGKKATEVLVSVTKLEMLVCAFTTVVGYFIIIFKA